MTDTRAINNYPSPREQALLDHLDKALRHAIAITLEQEVSQDVGNVLLMSLHAAKLTVQTKDPVFARRILDLASTPEEKTNSPACGGRPKTPKLRVIQGGEPIDDSAIF